MVSKLYKLYIHLYTTYIPFETGWMGVFHHSHKLMVIFFGGENHSKQDPLYMYNTPNSTIINGIWVIYNDLTATSLESWLIREIIPKWP